MPRERDGPGEDPDAPHCGPSFRAGELTAVALTGAVHTSVRGSAGRGLAVAVADPGGGIGVGEAGGQRRREDVAWRCDDDMFRKRR